MSTMYSGYDPSSSGFRSTSSWIVYFKVCKLVLIKPLLNSNTHCTNPSKNHHFVGSEIPQHDCTSCSFTSQRN